MVLPKTVIRFDATVSAVARTKLDEFGCFTQAIAA